MFRMFTDQNFEHYRADHSCKSLLTEAGFTQHFILEWCTQEYFWPPQHPRIFNSQKLWPTKDTHQSSQFIIYITSIERVKFPDFNYCISSVKLSKTVSCFMNKNATKFYNLVNSRVDILGYITKGSCIYFYACAYTFDSIAIASYKDTLSTMVFEHMMHQL